MISVMRIERAARAIWNSRHSNDLWDAGQETEGAGPSKFERERTRNEALDALTADAPEIAAAEIRGMEMAVELSKIAFETRIAEMRAKS